MNTTEALDPALVHEFVLQAHGNVDRVKELYEQEPRLINAAYDWERGDWETALGAAAHTGSKEIANFLLARGARLDVFAAAMLGKLEIIQAVLSAFPDALQVPGPHGIPLIEHARVGGEAAAPVQAFLEGLRSA
jgi:hypothetical protein